MLYFIGDLLALGCINAIMVVGLNLQYGYAGLLNFAFYAYVAVGAYIAAVTTMGPSTTPGIQYILGWSLPWYVGLLLGGLVSAALGALIFFFGIRRLRKDYMAIVTVAAAFIFWNIANTSTGLFDAATGVFNVPYITGSANVSITGYSLIIAGLGGAILCLFVFVSRLIFRSPYGRLLRAIREDETIAAAFGRVIWRPQLWIFMIGCFMAGVAGGVFVFYITAWSPSAFLPLESFFILSALIIGGSGNYWGGVFGAWLVIIGVNEAARYAPNFGHLAALGPIRSILIGTALIVMLRFRPEGVMPERWHRWYRRSFNLSREGHVADDRPVEAAQ